ncbi:MAG: hypothetical protein IPK85_02390 [Gemmatimonadetes bacterium]|nr:hypothetical protein [Gemmatimonadota bacterium]
MADARVLRDLAQEVERLDAPCDDMDARIGRAIGLDIRPKGDWSGAPHFTAALDAAAGLMPERWCPEIVHRGNLWRVWGRPSSGICVFGHGTTEAVARTACALRALAADLEGTDAPTV